MQSKCQRSRSGNYEDNESGLDLAKARQTCLGDPECTGVVEYPGQVNL